VELGPVSLHDEPAALIAQLITVCLVPAVHRVDVQSALPACPMLVDCPDQQGHLLCWQGLFAWVERAILRL
jgi:hypothetical protein